MISSAAFHDNKPTTPERDPRREETRRNKGNPRASASGNNYTRAAPGDIDATSIARLNNRSALRDLQKGPKGVKMSRENDEGEHERHRGRKIKLTLTGLPSTNNSTKSSAAGCAEKPRSAKRALNEGRLLLANMKLRELLQRRRKRPIDYVL